MVNLRLKAAAVLAILPIVFGPCVLARAAAAPLVIDGETLPAQLSARGFRPPERFKALVMELLPDDSGGFATRAWDYRGTADDRDDWWPASTVKIYAAIAALEKTHRLGFTPRAQATFEYDDGPVTVRVDKLVQLAITPSDNQAYDRLAEIVGFVELNDRFLVPERGLGSTVLQRAYVGRYRHPPLDKGSLRHTPPITLRQGKHTTRLGASLSDKAYDCPEEGNCTTLLDLSEAMRRVMLHEHLPPEGRFALGPPELELLRSALEGKRPRGNGVVDGLREGFGAEVPLRLYHKPGFALNWFSDVVFIHRTDTGGRWIVAMAGYPGREALDDAARHVGALLKAGALSAPLLASPAPSDARPSPAEAGIAPAPEVEEPSAGSLPTREGVDR